MESPFGSRWTQTSSVNRVAWDYSVDALVWSLDNVLGAGNQVCRVFPPLFAIHIKERRAYKRNPIFLPFHFYFPCGIAGFYSVTLITAYFR